MTWGLIFVLLLILGAEFVNGWTDAPNAIATVVSTRSLTPFQAVVMAAVLNLVGVFSGTAVAQTIGKGIIDPKAIDLITVGGAMVGIILWSSVAARWGIPTSESHALVAGLAGAGMATAGPGVLVGEGWKKVLIGLVFSTFLGFLGGLLVDHRDLLALSPRGSGEGPRDFPVAPGDVLRLHGIQPRLERRAEVHGRLHPRARARKRAPRIRHPDVGHLSLRGDDGRRHADGRVADHQDAWG